MQQADSADPYADPFHIKETIRQGDSLLYLMQFQNGTGGLDITDYQFVCTVKKSKLDSDSLAVSQSFLKTVPGTQTTNGILPFEAIPAYNSGNIPPDATYVIDVRYVTPGGQVATIIEGDITVLRPVSQNLTPP
jgi:hypothetical protein